MMHHYTTIRKDIRKKYESWTCRLNYINDGVIDDQTDSDGDGINDVTDLDQGANGVSTPDTDMDGLPDYQDVDSDNDGISDLIESGLDANLDSDNDGVLDDVSDADGDGMMDTVDINSGGTIGDIPDTDNDTIPDYQDADSDNDGVNDVVEVGGQDADGDGQIDSGDLLNTIDTDDDGIPDYLDPDDDNDGILTEDEDINNDGDIVNDDTDNDGVPNYLDIDDDNDGVLSINENSGDCDGDLIPDHLDATDCNLIPEGFSPNGDGVNDEFVIPLLSQYPNFSIEIYSRYGRKVYKYENKNSTNPSWWNGYANVSLTFNRDEMVPVGSYFYVTSLNDQNNRQYTGWVYVNR